MPDDLLTPERNPGRWLVFALGCVLCEAGVQAMLTSQTQPLHRTLTVALIGAVLVVIAIFWRRFHIDRTKFARRLNVLASSPSVWIALVAAIWAYSAVMNVVTELRQNNEIVELRNDDLSIAKVIDRLVLPRRLTERQQRVISQFLSQFQSHEYSFRLGRGEEIGQYRADIEQALIKGGWTRAAKDPYVYANNVQEGLRIEFTQTMEDSQKPSDARNPNASMILQEAFGLAGVRIDGTGGGSGVNVTEDRLTIEIGPARRDSYVFTAPEQ